jgi:hypothetical protein
VFGGRYVILDSLAGDELEAMQSMLFNDKAEIVNSACKSLLISKLDKFIVAS